MIAAALVGKNFVYKIDPKIVKKEIEYFKKNGC